jgi:hypothetical protein
VIRWRRLGSSAAQVAVTVGVSLLVACSGPPNGPGPINPPPPPPPTNTPPVIESIAASVSRTEVDSDVTVTATVRDAETPVSQLAYTWSADGGTVHGAGPTVTWRVAKGVTTPVEYAIKLTVTENYGSGQQNTVSATSTPIRVHDSPAELTTLSLTFLGDFANSSVSASSCVRNFTDRCPGKAVEKGQIEWNRDHYQILSSTLRMREVRIASTGTSADTRVGCGFTSRRTKCDSDEVGCKVGATETVGGDCTLTARYEEGRWWLCDSNFLADPGVSPGFRSFMNPPKLEY